MCAGEATDLHLPCAQHVALAVALLFHAVCVSCTLIIALARFMQELWQPLTYDRWSPSVLFRFFLWPVPCFCNARTQGTGILTSRVHCWMGGRCSGGVQREA